LPLSALSMICKRTFRTSKKPCERTMVDQPIDAEKARLVRYLRAKAHMYSIWEAPRTSKDAISLNRCADELEGINQEHTVSLVCHKS
jgi:hypothetical protein